MLALLPLMPNASVHAAAITSTYRTPIVIGTGADPDITTYDGMYYLLFNSDQPASEVRMRVAASLAGLADATDIVVWTPPPSMPQICCDVGWGGYLLPYSGRWYIYMQGDNGGSNPVLQSFVLESSGNNPLGPYAFKAFIPGVSGNYADGSYAAGGWQVGSQLYMFETGSGNGGIYVAKASNPWTLTSGFTLIDAVSNEDEGSSLRVHNGTVYDPGV
jgi:GH43 family beta-xylosidase